MVTRRAFLKAVAVGAALAPLQRAAASATPSRSLALLNTHTGESLEVEYCRSGCYDREALGKIDYLLRCHFTNEVKPIDVGVLDLLCDVKDRLGETRPIRIISAYRSPAYNEHLRSIGRGVASNSLHLRGLAIDFAAQGTDTGRLAGLARSLRGGGVGLYPEFVHIDTGPVRTW